MLSLPLEVNLLGLSSAVSVLIKIICTLPSCRARSNEIRHSRFTKLIYGDSVIHDLCSMYWAELFSWVAFFKFGVKRSVKLSRMKWNPEREAFGSSLNWGSMWWLGFGALCYVGSRSRVLLAPPFWCLLPFSGFRRLHSFEWLDSQSCMDHIQQAALITMTGGLFAIYLSKEEQGKPHWLTLAASWHAWAGRNNSQQWIRVEVLLKRHQSEIQSGLIEDYAEIYQIL